MQQQHMAPSSTSGHDAPSSSRVPLLLLSLRHMSLRQINQQRYKFPQKVLLLLLLQDDPEMYNVTVAKGFGHLMHDCPSQRALLIKDNGEYTSANDIEEEYAMLATNPTGDDQESEREEEQYGAKISDKYLSLIVKRVLSAQIERAKQNQHHNLFQTKLVIKERSCCVIIDRGSCNNLASIDMVEKLVLTTQQHPRPCYIQWFNNCGKLKVTRIVRVHFSIGSCHDYANCDVVPMQACSLLLGRPWQYDRDMVHHGRTNKY